MEHLPKTLSRSRNRAQRLDFGRGVVFRGYCWRMGQTKQKRPNRIRITVPIHAASVSGRNTFLMNSEAPQRIKRPTTKKKQSENHSRILSHNRTSLSETISPRRRGLHLHPCERHRSRPSLPYLGRRRHPLRTLASLVLDRGQVRGRTERPLARPAQDRGEEAIS